MSRITKYTTKITQHGKQLHETAFYRVPRKNSGYYSVNSLEQIVNSIKNQLKYKQINGVMHVLIYTNNSLKCIPTHHFDIQSNIEFKLTDNFLYDEMVDFKEDNITFFDVFYASDNNKGGADGKLNDCLWHCLMNCEITKWGQPSLLKHALHIPRDAPIYVSQLDYIEKACGVGIFVIGDIERQPKIVAKRNITLKLTAGHYSVYVDLAHMKNKIFDYKYAHVRVYHKTTTGYEYFDGKTTTTFEHKDRQKNMIDVHIDEIRKKVDDKWVKMNTLQEAYEQIQYEVKVVGDAGIDILKTGWVNRTFLKYFFRKLKKNGIDVQPIQPHEIRFIQGASSGAYVFCKKGKYEQLYDYDRKCHYASTLIDDKIFMPIGVGILGNKTTENMNKSTNGHYSSGIYHCTIEFKPEYEHKFKYNNIRGYYTHLDLFVAWKLGLKITMDDEVYNFLAYPKQNLIKSHLIFKELTDWFYKLRTKAPNSYFLKMILSTNWGLLSSANKKYVCVPLNQTVVDIEDEFTQIKDAEIVGNTKEFAMVDPSNYFKYSIARIKPFVLSASRKWMFTNVLIEHYDKIVRFHTDGFLTTDMIEEYDNNNGNIGDIVFKGQKERTEIINMQKCQSF